MRQGAARAPRRRAGQQAAQQEQRPAAHPRARPAWRHLGSRRLERGGRTRSGGREPAAGHRPPSRPPGGAGPSRSPSQARAARQPVGPGPADSSCVPPLPPIHLPPRAPALVPEVGFSGERSDGRPGRRKEEVEAEARGSGAEGKGAGRVSTSWGPGAGDPRGKNKELPREGKFSLTEEGRTRVIKGIILGLLEGK